MKTKFLLTLVTLPLLIFGQITNHFEHMDTKWNVAKTYTNANPNNPNFAATTTTVYGYKGDTLINTEKWLNLYATSDSSFSKNLIFKGVTRKDGNRILFLDNLNKLDTLYNFNLKLGDTALFNLSGNQSVWLPIILIDSIQINGQFYKRFKFAEPKGPNAFDKLNEMWIEGIGSIHGPLFPINPRKFLTEIPDSLMLTCTNVNNQQIWKHPFYNSCYVNIVLGSKNIEKTKLTVYPNPFTTSFQINFAKTDHYQISIFNAKGQKIIEKNVSLISAIIDFSLFNDGIYFLAVDNNKERWTKTIIKNNR